MLFSVGAESRAPIEESFRRSGSRWFMVACIGGFCLVAISQVPPTAYEDGAWSPDAGLTIAFRIGFAVAAVALLYLMIRIARMGIFADRDGLTIRNIVNTRRAAWSEIAGFERPARYGALRRTGLRVVLRSEPPIFASIYNAGPFNNPGFADATIARLEALRVRYTRG